MVDLAVSLTTLMVSQGLPNLKPDKTVLTLVANPQRK